MTDVLDRTAGPGQADEGLRARKKRETRHAIHRAAIALIHEGGYCEVTVDSIAARAGVSPRTFFNYFPTKDAAISGADPELPQRLRDLMAQRPAEEDTVSAVRAVTLERFREMVHDRELWSMRRDLMKSEPSLGVSIIGVSAMADRAIAEAALARVGSTIEDDLPTASLAFAALGSVRAAVWQHISADFEGSLEERIDAALAASGLRALPS